MKNILYTIIDYIIEIICALIRLVRPLCAIMFILIGISFFFGFSLLVGGGLALVAAIILIGFFTGLSDNELRETYGFLLSTSMIMGGVFCAYLMIIFNYDSSINESHVYDQEESSIEKILSAFAQIINESIEIVGNEESIDWLLSGIRSFKNNKND